MSESILVIEDNKRLRKFIVSSLVKHGYESIETDSSKSAYEHMKISYQDRNIKLNGSEIHMRKKLFDIFSPLEYENKHRLLSNSHTCSGIILQHLSTR